MVQGHARKVDKVPENAVAYVTAGKYHAVPYHAHEMVGCSPTKTVAVQSCLAEEVSAQVHVEQPKPTELAVTVSIWEAVVGGKTMLAVVGAAAAVDAVAVGVVVVGFAGVAGVADVAGVAGVADVADVVVAAAAVAVVVDAAAVQVDDLRSGWTTQSLCSKVGAHDF